MKARLLKKLEAMNPAIKEFLSHMSWSFVGGMISAVTLLGVSILAGRLLGPTEYGKFNFIGAVAQIIFAIVIFGMDRSSMRSIAQANNHEERSKNLSTPLQFVALVSVIFSVFYILAHPFLARFFEIETVLLLAALFYGLALSFRQMLNNVLRGLHEFKFQSNARVLESLTILAAFGGLFYFSTTATYDLYAYALMAGYGAFIVACLYKVKSYFAGFDFNAFKKQFSFAKIYFIAVVLGTLFGSLDKILIGKYLSFYELGIYGAYFAAALNLTTQINSIFGNVFFPTLSKNLSKTHLILKKVDQLSVALFVPILLLDMAVIMVIMNLLGPEYPITLAYVFGFSFMAVSQMIFAINGLMASVYSKATIALTTILGNISNLLFAGFYLVLVLFVGLSIEWVLGLLILHNVVETLICKYALWREGAYRSTAPLR